MTTASPRLQGVLSPVVTPFDRDLRPDAPRLIQHCRWLLDQGVGLAVFGTNSEANSLSLAEKLTLLDALAEGGVPPTRMKPGTGLNAYPETIELTRHAVRLGCAGVLMLPPFFYKGVSDEGLFRAYARIIEGVGDERLRIYLYHIPPVAQVGISLALIERLLNEFPDTIAGIKDSSGDWTNTRAMLEQFQPRGFDVFAGSESFLLATLRGGGAGCITATGNVNPAAIAHLARTWRQGDADAQQAALDAVRQIFARYPMIAAMKAALADASSHEAWSLVRPPLVELDPAQRSDLLWSLRDAGFTLSVPGPG